MTSLKEILEKIYLQDLAVILEHNPSAEEQKAVFDWVIDAINDAWDNGNKVFWPTLDGFLYDACNALFSQCDECGNYYLPGETNECEHKCVNCKPKNNEKENM